MVYVESEGVMVSEFCEDGKFPQTTNSCDELVIFEVYVKVPHIPETQEAMKAS